MPDEEQPDRYALGLLVDLRELCEEIGTKNDEFHSRLWELLRQVANPHPQAPQCLCGA